MNDYILLMHNDVAGKDASGWHAYLAMLRETGSFLGGSSIGEGVCISKSGDPRDITQHLSGYVKIQAESLSDAKNLVAGNPVYEAGGTIEIRELPKD